MARYLDIDGLKGLLIIPSSYVDDAEALEAGWVQRQLDHWSRWIDTRLRKRYVSPFAAFDADPPTPPAIQGWLARILAVRVMMKCGVSPNDEQFQLVLDDYKEAKEEVTEAADAEKGLFDLPLIADSDATGVARMETRAYSEQSPYVGLDAQAETAHNEDGSRGGTYV